MIASKLAHKGLAFIHVHGDAGQECGDGVCRVEVGQQLRVEAQGEVRLHQLGGVVADLQHSAVQGSSGQCNTDANKHTQKIGRVGGGKDNKLK
jgi:hypothetical protein